MDRTTTYSTAARGGRGLRRILFRFLSLPTRLFHLPGEQAGVGNPSYGRNSAGGGPVNKNRKAPPEQQGGCIRSARHQDFGCFEL